MATHLEPWEGEGDLRSGILDMYNSRTNEATDCTFQYVKICRRDAVRLIEQVMLGPFLLLY